MAKRRNKGRAGKPVDLSTVLTAPRHEELHENDGRSFEMFGKWYHWTLVDGVLSLVQGPTAEDQAKAQEARVRIEQALTRLEKIGQVDSLTEVQQDVQTVTVDELMAQGVTEADLVDPPVIRTVGEPVLAKKPEHDLEGTSDDSVHGVASWFCICGKSGTTSRSHDGEDLVAKARKNHAAHARREAKKAEA